MDRQLARAIVNKLGSTGTPPEFGIEHFTVGLEPYLKVLEDAAQAHGARYKGRRTGALGHAAGQVAWPGVLEPLQANLVDPGLGLRPGFRRAAALQRLRDSGWRVPHKFQPSVQPVRNQ